MYFPPYFCHMTTKSRFIHYGFLDNNQNMAEKQKLNLGLALEAVWGGEEVPVLRTMLSFFPLPQCFKGYP